MLHQLQTTQWRDMFYFSLVNAIFGFILNDFIFGDFECSFLSLRLIMSVQISLLRAWKTQIPNILCYKLGLGRNILRLVYVYTKLQTIMKNKIEKNKKVKLWVFCLVDLGQKHKWGYCLPNLIWKIFLFQIDRIQWSNFIMDGSLHVKWMAIG